MNCAAELHPLHARVKAATAFEYVYFGSTPSRDLVSTSMSTVLPYSVWHTRSCFFNIVTTALS